MTMYNQVLIHYDKRILKKVNEKYIKVSYLLIYICICVILYREFNYLTITSTYNHSKTQPKSITLRCKINLKFYNS